MRLRKFQAATMRDAIAEVKRELGADAMIVATRQISRGLRGPGVEVTAAIDSEGPAAEPTPQPVAPDVGGGTGPARAHGRALEEADVERILLPLRSELRSLRSALRASGDGELRSELAHLRRALAQLPGRAAEREPLRQVAARARLAAPSEAQAIALVGPTGVGKTTTLAKLAARAALIAEERVAIVSLDSYRVGGEEQIRAYADLIGVPLRVVTDPARLGQTLAELGERDRIYIDTAGRSPRDQAAVAELAEAFAAVDDLEVHLTLSAATTPSLIDGIARRFQALSPARLLFTKVDEADDLAELVRAPARLGRPVAWVTTGQRVPEDLEDATVELLLSLAERQVEVAA
jgi:flagellar biosynthesis protein FlhF